MRAIWLPACVLQTVQRERDGKRADVDNLAKNVLDSCNRVLWDDDRQVDHLAVCRHPPDKANPRTVVRVERIPD